MVRVRARCIVNNGKSRIASATTSCRIRRIINPSIRIVFGSRIRVCVCVRALTLGLVCAAVIT